MSQRKIIEIYHSDLNNLVTIVNQLSNSYRVLIGGADELNKIALARKSEVRKAIKRADKLGDVIDDYIKALDKVSPTYIEYCELKSELIKCKLEAVNVGYEIDDEIKEGITKV